MEVHGITTDEVSGLTVLLGDAEAVAEIVAFVGESVLVAHNAPFEKRWLDVLGIEAVYADTMTAFAALVDDPAVSDNTMRSLVEWSGGEYVEAHRALADTHMLAGAMRSLLPLIEAHVEGVAVAA